MSRPCNAWLEKTSAALRIRVQLTQLLQLKAQRFMPEQTPMDSAALTRAIA
jgi:hypothetical protein